MKEILQEVLALEHEIDDNENWVCSDEDMTNITRFIVNKTLETQALALEGMKKPGLTQRPPAAKGQYCGTMAINVEYNTALQQAADHLRSQKIDV